MLIVKIKDITFENNELTFLRICMIILYYKYIFIARTGLKKQFYQ